MPQLPSKPRVETVSAMTAASLFQSEGTVVSRGWCDRLCTFNNFLSSCQLASDADAVTETCRTERGKGIPSFWLEDQGEPWGNWWVLCRERERKVWGKWPMKSSWGSRLIPRCTPVGLTIKRFMINHQRLQNSLWDRLRSQLVPVPCS